MVMHGHFYNSWKSVSFISNDSRNLLKFVTSGNWLNLWADVKFDYSPISIPSAIEQGGIKEVSDTKNYQIFKKGENHFLGSDKLNGVVCVRDGFQSCPS